MGGAEMTMSWFFVVKTNEGAVYDVKERTIFLF